MCNKEQELYCERLQKEIAVRRLLSNLTDENLDNLLKLLRSDNGIPTDERTLRTEHRESDCVD